MLTSTEGYDYRFYDSTRITGYQRIAQALDRAKYDFVQLCPDDDFINIPTTFDLAEILSQTTDAIAAYGDYINFISKRAEDQILIWSFPDLSARDYMLDSEIDRLFWSMNEGSINSYYGVFRRQALAKAMRGVIDVIDHYENEQFDFGFGDPLLICLLMCQGKMRHVPLPYFAKEIGQSIFEFTGLPGNELFKDSDFHTKYSKIQSKLIEFLPAGTPRKAALTAIDASWQAFLGGANLSSYNLWNGLQQTRMNLGLPYEAVAAMSVPPEPVPGLASDYLERYNFLIEFMRLSEDYKSLMVIEEWGAPHYDARRFIGESALAHAAKFPQIAVKVAHPLFPRFEDTLTL